MKSAEERIKEAFPDYNEWADWTMDKTVALMKEYARNVAQDALDRAGKSRELSVFGREVVRKTKIKTP